MLRHIVLLVLICLQLAACQFIGFPTFFHPDPYGNVVTGDDSNGFFLLCNGHGCAARG
ncbi:unnamed protein product [Heligmosomoides polygyrus]|uniref:Lipoprotein n=1 Tax=Heligmosomoides polygyrus TaxID=6339 RepID=A0A183GU34_HELPZ|nr:unnamed protein product [Heligmosomoides polygyrus]